MTVDSKEKETKQKEAEEEVQNKEKGNHGSNHKKTKGKSQKTASTAKIRELEKKLEETEKERNELKDTLLRKAAEFENYKRRRENEFIQLIASSNAELIAQLLPILDDYERSMKAAKESRDFDSFFQGIELIYKNLTNVLEKQGVKPIEAVGQPFDPDLHDALMQVERNDHPPGTVVEEHLKGYTMHDRVLRHAQVIVSKEESGESS
ncbi:nucleotide exchange factor GrpE [candidate division KSB1 bacterium]|nr:nucleotide exchange factor GrpE [candidate division KSB1 bacterium]NIR71346.1 nucleotide exchange factor GrpE [candidate division KSB1 bacterium]NIS26236.1 nucleotide exchange factor GrpE [candidate division KSB1 bacterium]NIT74666.1 nucleotide exchange factor GrpE [candidate division KSB1 bacterium]NIU26884.1 nucleotide exchange factor GrpE [candidate division KSB1 bacterium]